jgi:hypothetical protein
MNGPYSRWRLLRVFDASFELRASSSARPSSVSACDDKTRELRAQNPEFGSAHRRRTCQRMRAIACGDAAAARGHRTFIGERPSASQIW